MLDWLKFFPFEYRCDWNTKEMRGPYFPALRPNKWFLSDSLIRFSAPKSNPIFGFRGNGSKVNALSPGSANILKTEWERVYGSASEAPPGAWDRNIFYSDIWYFVGPWFTGYKASLRASSILISAKKDNVFFEKNLFHPRIFEASIANYLDAHYGYCRSGMSGFKPKFRGPLNWRVLPISPSIQAVVCDVHEIGEGTRDNPLLHRQIFFPVTPNQMIRVNFDFGGTQVYKDEARAKPLFELCNAIIDSFRMEVGEHTQAEWDKVKATCPDMSITPTFGELPWPLKAEKPGSKREEVDITPAQKIIEPHRS